MGKCGLTEKALNAVYSFWKLVSVLVADVMVCFSMEYFSDQMLMSRVTVSVIGKTVNQELYQFWLLIHFQILVLYLNHSDLHIRYCDRLFPIILEAEL